MNCPACDNQLEPRIVEGLSVDVCKNGCGGIWFDNFEIKKFDEPHESLGADLLNVEKNPTVVVDRSKRLKCPKCDDIVMMRHFFSVKKQVEVDECPGCAGIWLDTGELGAIRSLFNTEQERHDAAEEYFSEIFGNELAAMKAKNQAELEKARKVAKTFRFICPTKYIPGKQDWGAF